MPTVNSSLIASLVKGYYDFVNSNTSSGNIVFRIGLNASPSWLTINTSCTSTGSPGCVNATYNATVSSGTMTASFSATFAPSNGYTLSELSLAALNTSISWKWQLGLIDMTGFSAQVSAGTSYTVVLQDQITYPTTI